MTQTSEPAAGSSYKTIALGQGDSAVRYLVVAEMPIGDGRYADLAKLDAEDNMNGEPFSTALVSNDGEETTYSIKAFDALEMPVQAEVTTTLEIEHRRSGVYPTVRLFVAGEEGLYQPTVLTCTVQTGDGKGMRYVELLDLDGDYSELGGTSTALVTADGDYSIDAFLALPPYDQKGVREGIAAHHRALATDEHEVDLTAGGHEIPLGDDRQADSAETELAPTG